MQTILLDLFASIALIASGMVIISKNPIHSVIFLILVFFNATALLLVLELEFIAMMFLIIYVGAIAVLFLFVVMMLNIKVNELDLVPLRYLPIGSVISMIFLLEIFLILDSDWVPLRKSIESTWKEEISETQRTWVSLLDGLHPIQTLGNLIYTHYFYYFLMSSLILLVAMIGAIVLTMHKRKNASKRQIGFKQVARSFEEAIGYANNKKNT